MVNGLLARGCSLNDGRFSAGYSSAYQLKRVPLVSDTLPTDVSKGGASVSSSENARGNRNDARKMQCVVTTIRPYNVFTDVNDGVVNIADVQIVRTRVGTSLP
jgi:hypothetical protein